MAGVAPEAVGSKSATRRWIAGSLVVVFALGGTLIWLLAGAISRYEDGHATGIRGITATVVYAKNSRRIAPEYIRVEWADADRRSHRATIQVSDAADYPVGTPLAIRVSATDLEQAYPESQALLDRALLLPRIGLWSSVGFLVLAALLWTVQAMRWSRAAGEPAIRHSAQVWHPLAPFDRLGVRWLTIVDSRGIPWHQRVYWEPWLDPLGQEIAVDVLRAGNGPFVVDVPGYGRLWPVGRARPSQPRATSKLSDAWAPGRRSQPPATGKPSDAGPRDRRSRAVTLLLFAVVVGIIGILCQGLFGPVSLVPIWLPALFASAGIWLCVVSVGAPPFPLPWRLR